MYRHSWIDVANKRFALPWGENFISLKHLRSRETYHKPCYMYHVSVTPLGGSLEQFSKTLIKPKRIRTSESEICQIKRFCVAPTVEQCLVAIAQDAWYNKKMFIYRTVRKQNKSYIPRGAYDAPITQERWINRPVTVQLVGEINKEYESDGTIKFTNDIDFELDTENRGGNTSTCFRQQMLEYYELKRLFKLYENNLFYNNNEVDIHRSQRDLRLKINRG